MMYRQETFSDADSVRRALEKTLKREIKENVWDYLEKKGYVEEVLRGYGTLKELKRKYRLLEKLGQGRGKRANRVTLEETGSRAEILRRLLAAEASRNPRVACFRREVLGDRLLSPEEVPTWIQGQARKDGPATVWVTVPAQGKPHETDPGRIIWEGAPPEKVREWEIETLRYLRPDGHPERVMISVFGILGRLKALAEELAAAYWWSTEEAVNFILTGRFPAIRKAEVRLEYRGRQVIALTADVSLSPEEVGKLYGKFRRWAVGWVRRLDKKSQELAAFCVEHMGSPWRGIMERWNVAHPEWAYSDVRRFYRDAKAALRHPTMP